MSSSSSVKRPPEMVSAPRSLIARSARYVHTVRHLRPVQIYGRLWSRLRPTIVHCSPAPPLRERGGPWHRPAQRCASMEAPDTFCFLNRRGRLALPFDWNSPEYDKLWLYNLHYFDDLNAAGSATRVDWHRGLIARWIEDNAPGHGNGWEPYPLSLRIVNWIKWGLGGNQLDAEALHSLAMQARYLATRVEWHLLGNHLLANAKALTFAGLFFAGDEAEAWRCCGLDILARELPEQVLADGGHFELSPMYHSIIVEDLLDLINLTRAYPNVVPERTVRGWTATVQRMRSWLAAMLHPDGGISFFNDAAHGVAASPAELEAYAQRLDLGRGASPRDGITHLSPSGYVKVQRGDFVAVLDVGQVGPDYLPGHAHADTLSFEISVLGQRMLVNSGTSIYEGGPKRHDERSTAAHNTVEVDGENSSEVWGAFRVARRAHPLDLSVTQVGDEICVSCAHDGYRRLSGKVTHRRQWRFSPDAFAIEDWLEGGFVNAVSHLHFHPDICASSEEGFVESAKGLRLDYHVQQGEQSMVEYSYHPEFGLSVPARCLKLEISAASCAIGFNSRKAN